MEKQKRFRCAMGNNISLDAERDGTAGKFEIGTRPCQMLRSGVDFTAVGAEIKTETRPFAGQA